MQRCNVTLRLSAGELLLERDRRYGFSFYHLLISRAGRPCMRVTHRNSDRFKLPFHRILIPQSALPVSTRILTLVMMTSDYLKFKCVYLDWSVKLQLILETTTYLCLYFIFIKSVGRYSVQIGICVKYANPVLNRYINIVELIEIINGPLKQIVTINFASSPHKSSEGAAAVVADIDAYKVFLPARASGEITNDETMTPIM